MEEGPGGEDSRGVLEEDRGRVLGEMIGGGVLGERIVGVS